jgi:formylglycine-generating enzyme required for sulfatase activity
MATVVALPGCTSELPPYGEVIVEVDTDLIVPRMAGRLRVDVYDEDGSWYESRDIARPNARDWPASFSIVNRDEEAPHEVLLRLRAYPEGQSRRYEGERFQDVTFTEPFVAHSVAELCENAQELPLGEARVVRRGRDPFIGYLDGGLCSKLNTETGSAALFVDIPRQGTYRFAVLETIPGVQTGSLDAQITIQLRRTCEDASTAVICESGVDPSLDETFELTDFEVALEPGRYFLVTGGATFFQAPTDFVIAAAEASNWDTVHVPSEEPLVGTMLLLDGTAEHTPPTEPIPSVTVDRLIRLRLEPEVVRTLPVTLHAACLGTMAKLRADVATPDAVLAEAETCIATEKTREAPKEVSEDSLMPRPATMLVRDDGCEANDHPSAACVPGGLLLLGSRDGIANSPHHASPSLPERWVVVPRFWMDRHEVTVARWRRAIAEGFGVPWYDTPQVNQGPLLMEPEESQCTFNLSPPLRDQYPVSCISFYGARAFCQFYGGDLPTEAQWEYAATAAGRELETRFPWGDEPPSCDCASWEPCRRAVTSCGAEEQPLPKEVNVSEALGDVVPELGIIGLGGSLQEHTLGSFRPYDHACWSAALLVGGGCWESESPRRAIRGGAWNLDPVWTTASMRDAFPPSMPDGSIGFRCVYPVEPP